MRVAAKKGDRHRVRPPRRETAKKGESQEWRQPRSETARVADRHGMRHPRRGTARKTVVCKGGQRHTSCNFHIQLDAF